MSFTPGPWAIRHSRDGSGDVGITANGVANVIAECFAAMRSSGENARDEALDNARLIAAAPDLLAALKEVVAISDRKHDAWDRARAALSKAEGHIGQELAPDPERRVNGNANGGEK